MDTVAPWLSTLMENYKVGGQLTSMSNVPGVLPGVNLSPVVYRKYM